MAGENLTPRQLAYLRRLWLFHQPGVMERRYKIMMGVGGSLTILLFAASLFGMANKWPSAGLWMVGFFAGIFEIAVVQLFTSKKRWQVIEPYIDWDRINATLHKD